MYSVYLVYMATNYGIFARDLVKAFPHKYVMYGVNICDIMFLTSHFSACR